MEALFLVPVVLTNNKQSPKITDNLHFDPLASVLKLQPELPDSAISKTSIAAISKTNKDNQANKTCLKSSPQSGYYIICEVIFVGFRDNCDWRFWDFEIWQLWDCPLALAWKTTQNSLQPSSWTKTLPPPLLLTPATRNARSIWIWLETARRAADLPFRSEAN